MAKLICISGMSKGEEYILAPGEITLGRSESNDICVLDKKASRAHCKLILDEENLTLVDLCSTNGIRVNNELVLEEIILHAGDNIKIGQTVYLVNTQPISEEEKEESELSNTQKIRKQKKYNNLLHQTGFQMTQTSNFKKLKKEDTEQETGFLAFFKKNKETKDSDES